MDELSENIVLAARVFLSVAVIVAAYTDLCWSRVFDWCSITTCVAGLSLGLLPLVIHGNAGMLVSSVVLAMMAFFVFFIPFYFGMVGAGDVKLITGVGALCAPLGGLSFLLLVLFLTSIIGAIFATVVLLWRGLFLRGVHASAVVAVKSVKEVSSACESVIEKAEKNDALRPATFHIPYGLAIAIGTLWALHRTL